MPRAAQSTEPPLVMVFPRGQLTAKDRAALKAAGVIAVEADSPKDVAQLHLTGPLVSSCVSGDGIVKAALAAIAMHKPNDGLLITPAGQIAHKFICLLSEQVQQEATN